MRPTRHRLGALALTLLLSCALIPSRGASQTKRPSATSSSPSSRAAGGQRTLVFAVIKYEAAESPAAEVQIEPITMVVGGRFTEPPVAGLSEAADAERNEKSFIAEYFRPGRTYRLLFGGGEAGKVTVKQYLEPGCVGLVASATADTQAKLGGEVLALATDSDALGRGKGTRRAPTAEERAAALALARTLFRSKRVAPSALEKIKTNNLTAIDLDADGRAELVGSYFIEMQPHFPQHTALLIAEPRGASFAATLSWYHFGSEENFELRRLVDAVDLDGDGVSEVIAGGSYYESNDYFVYQRTPTGWRVVYQGGGGGC
ncbi:MAG TPA: hypothetical protein VGV59_12610 [Pyrinomonadaceae bacterium]|nr:hypothetical protein [Pyrinomonadaceae bacterium]